jgi:hypothetical protein
MDRAFETWKWSRDRWAWCLSVVALFIVYQSIAGATRAGLGEHYRSVISTFIQVIIFGGTYLHAMQLLVRARASLGRQAFASLHLAFAFLCCMALVLVERLIGPSMALY